MKKPSSISLHEMSHAMVAHGLGQRVGLIRLIEDDVGYTDIGMKISDPIIKSSIAIAGHEADTLWYGAHSIEFPENDYNLLVDMGVTMRGANILRSEVIGFLKKHKKLIFALARELDERRKIGRNTFLRIIRESL